MGDTVQHYCGVMVLDLACRSALEIFEAYQCLALLIHAEQAPHMVLIKTGEEDPELHYTLRDLLCTLARIAGTPVRARVAVVGEGADLGAVCRAMNGSLQGLGCPVERFGDVAEAGRWLLEEPAGIPERHSAVLIPFS